MATVTLLFTQTQKPDTRTGCSGTKLRIYGGKLGSSKMWIHHHIEALFPKTFYFSPSFAHICNLQTTMEARQ